MNIIDLKKGGFTWTPPCVLHCLAYGSTANFQFRGPIAKINISKERQDYGDCSGPRILEIDSVILKLSRFPQVQSERERTLVAWQTKHSTWWTSWCQE